MFAEPLAGWREATVRATKTKVDWAVEVARLLEGRYADCPYVTLVCDNLNTHTAGAFYAAFEPEPARKLVARTRFLPHAQARRLAQHRAECERSAMTRQCVDGRRFGTEGELRREASAWSTDVTGRQRGVEWHMAVDDARVKLASVYPKIVT